MVDKKKVILVTGGSRGIGKDIVQMLAEKGHSVILNYNKSKESAIQIKEELQQKGLSIQIYKADVSIREEVKNMVHEIIKNYGNIDVLVNNAGISQYKLFTDITDEEWDNMLQINLNSVFYCTQEVLPMMIHNKKGCIINISSVWGIVGASCETHYSTSKSAVNGLTKALAKELGPSGIRVNAIAPGVINTDMNKNLTQDELIQLKMETPLAKIGNPIDISRCVNWLIDDEFTTGQVISINGGWIIT